MSEYNPILTVDGQEVPCPSTFVYNLQDVSIADSGRTEDGLMHKNRLTQKVKLELAWNGVDTQKGSQVLNAFDPEYVEMCYLDLKQGTYVTKTFYIGDRKSPFYNSRLDIWENLSFNAIER